MLARGGSSREIRKIANEGSKVKPVAIRVAKRTGAAVLAALCFSCATARAARLAPCAPSAATAQACLEISDRPFAASTESPTRSITICRSSARIATTIF